MSDTTQVTGQEIMGSIPGKDLMYMAIITLIKEGTPWREVSKDIDGIAWEIDREIKRGGL